MPMPWARGPAPYVPPEKCFFPSTMDIYGMGSGAPVLRQGQVDILISGSFLEGSRTRVAAGDAYTHVILCDEAIKVEDGYAGDDVTPATPGFVAGSGSGGSGTSLSLSAPAGMSAGNRLVATIAYSNASTVTVSPPSGWALVVETANSTDGIYQLTYTKTATSSEPSSYTWNFSSNVGFVGVVEAWSGVTGVNGYSGQADSGTSITAPSLSPSTPGCQLLYRGSATGPPGWTGDGNPAWPGIPAGYTERESQPEPTGILLAADANDPTAGGTGTVTATAHAGTVGGVGQLIALAPGGGGPGSTPPDQLLIPAGVGNVWTAIATFVMGVGRHGRRRVILAARQSVADWTQLV